jgi:hypothetical protein
MRSELCEFSRLAEVVKYERKPTAHESSTFRPKSLDARGCDAGSLELLVLLLQSARRWVSKRMQLRGHPAPSKRPESVKLASHLRANERNELSSPAELLKRGGRVRFNISERGFCFIA